MTLNEIFAANDAAIAFAWTKAKEDAEIVKIIHEEVRIHAANQ